MLSSVVNTIETYPTERAAWGPEGSLGAQSASGW